jgi:hypothetical protein
LDNRTSGMQNLLPNVFAAPKPKGLSLSGVTVEWQKEGPKLKLR